MDVSDTGGSAGARLVRSPDLRTMARADRRHVMVCNRDNGAWLKLPAALFRYVDEALTQGETDIPSVIADVAQRTDLEPDVISRFVDNLMENEFYVLEGTQVQPPWDHAYVFATTRCNLRCRHCSGAWEASGEDLSTDMAEKLADWILAGRGVERIVITGGEPLLNPSLPAILDLFRTRLGSDLQIQTNGTTITPEWVELFLRYDVDIEISLDGHDAETVSAIRGRGVYERVMENIAMMRALGFDRPIGMSMTTTRLTVDCEEAFRSLCERLGAAPQVRLIVPLGRAAENRELLEPLPEQFDPLAVSKETLRGLPALDPCGGLMRYFAVGVDGAVYPCPNLMEPAFLAGNIQDPSGLRLETSAGAHALDAYRVDNQDTCSSCDVRYLCNNGSCFSSNRALHGSLSMCGAPLCEFTKREYGLQLWGAE